MLSFRRRRRVLRAALLGLLALGLMINPALGALGELHEAEHAALTHAGQGHAHDADLDHDHRDTSDPDHATGPHGLLHLGSVVPEALSETMDPPPGQAPAALRLPDTGPFLLPGDVPDLPFRPPIA